MHPFHSTASSCHIDIRWSPSTLLCETASGRNISVKGSLLCQQACFAGTLFAAVRATSGTINWKTTYVDIQETRDWVFFHSLFFSKIDFSLFFRLFYGLLAFFWPQGVYPSSHIRCPKSFLPERPRSSQPRTTTMYTVDTH